jgi:hypothetical protein
MYVVATVKRHRQRSERPALSSLTAGPTPSTSPPATLSPLGSWAPATGDTTPIPAPEARRRVRRRSEDWNTPLAEKERKKRRRSQRCWRREQGRRGGCRGGENRVAATAKDEERRWFSCDMPSGRLFTGRYDLVSSSSFWISRRATPSSCTRWGGGSQRERGMVAGDGSDSRASSSSLRATSSFGKEKEPAAAPEEERRIWCAAAGFSWGALVRRPAKCPCVEEEATAPACGGCVGVRRETAPWRREGGTERHRASGMKDLAVGLPTAIGFRRLQHLVFCDMKELQKCGPHPPLQACLPAQRCDQPETPPLVKLKQIARYYVHRICKVDV